MSVFHKKPITHISNIAIKVSNLNESLLFYKKVLGMHVLEKSKNEAKLTADGVTSIVRLIEIEKVEKPIMKTTGLYHFALLLPTRDDLAQFYQHILDKNIPFGASDHHVSEAIYIQDPDGNGIEVYADRSSDTWRWVHEQVVMPTVRMDGQQLLANKTKDWDVMPADTVLGHLHLHVNHLKEAKKYCRALGFSVVNEFHGAVFMSAGNYHHHIAFNIWNGMNAIKPKDQFVGLQFFTIKYKDEEARDHVMNALLDMNVKCINKTGKVIINQSPFGEIHLVI